MSKNKSKAFPIYNVHKIKAFLGEECYTPCTQLRIPLIPQPIWEQVFFLLENSKNPSNFTKCPLGKRGDSFYVQEKFAWTNGSLLVPGEKFKHCSERVGLLDQHCTYAEYWHGYYLGNHPKWKKSRWKSPTQMPAYASRISGTILDFRLEQLQNISKEDAVAEGLRVSGTEVDKKIKGGIYFDESFLYIMKGGWSNPINAFSYEWDSHWGKKFPFDSNPWVWVINFQPSVDESVGIFN